MKEGPSTLTPYPKTPGPTPAEPGIARPGLDYLLDTMPCGAFTLSRTGVVSQLNERAATLWGVDRAVLLGQLLPLALVPAPLYAALQHIRSQPPAPTKPSRFFLTRSQQWVAMSTVPTADGGLLVYWQDITWEQQRETWYHTLANHIPDLITRWDRDLRLIYANAALIEKSGQPLSWLLGKTNRQMGQPEEIAAPWMAMLTRAFETGELQQHYHVYPTPEGEAHYFSRLVPEVVDGQVQTVLAIDRDISDLKQAEAERQRQARFMAQVANATPDLIYVLQLADRQLTYANEQVYQVVGRAPNRPYAQGPYSFALPVHPDDYEQRMAHLTACAHLADQEVRQQKVRLRVADGSWRWFCLRDKVFERYPDGSVSHVIGSGQDIHAQTVAEQELATSRAFLQENLDAVAQIVWTHLSTGEVTFYNERWYAYTGLNYEQSRGLGWQQVCHPDEVAMIMTRLAAAVQRGESQDFESRNRRHDGQYRWHLNRTRAVRNEAGEIAYWIGTGTDIHDRKMAETELQRSRQLLQATLDSSSNIIQAKEAVRDAQGRIVDFRWRLTNNVAARLFGDVIGCTVLDKYPGAVPSGLFERFKEVTETGQPARFELEYCHEHINGWYDLSVVKMDDGVVVTTTDITDRKRAELALQQSKELLEAIFDISTGAFAVIKTITEGDKIVDFEFVLTNGVAAEWLGARNLVGRRYSEAYPAVKQTGLFTAFLRVMKTGVPLDNEQVFLGEGFHKWYRITARKLGELLVTTAEDITARKQAEADQLARQQQLANAVLEAQEGERRRIAEALHNGLGQQLYATKLHLDLLEGPSESDAAQQFVEAKRKATRLLSDAITQTRTISHQLMPTALAEFGLAVAVQDICSNYSSPQLRMQGWVAAQAQAWPSNLQLAVYRMAQELASNIVKHASASHASLHLDEQKGWIVLQAIDDGCGVGTQPTNGLGLKAMHDRTKLLNGKMAINSMPGQGTQISIRLPLTPELAT
jgi:two-component system NarL family sensor kinase